MNTQTKNKLCRRYEWISVVINPLKMYPPSDRTFGFNLGFSLSLLHEPSDFLTVRASLAHKGRLYPRKGYKTYKYWD